MPIPMGPKLCTVKSLHTFCLSSLEMDTLYADSVSACDIILMLQYTDDFRHHRVTLTMVVCSMSLKINGHRAK